jgi:hypothetical protein
MFDLAASDPVDLREGDRLETTSTIRRGDVVCFERMEPDLVRFRSLSEDEQADYAGPMYRIDRGERPGQVVVKRVGAASGSAGPG